MTHFLSKWENLSPVQFAAISLISLYSLSPSLNLIFSRFSGKAITPHAKTNQQLVIVVTNKFYTALPHTRKHFAGFLCGSLISDSFFLCLVGTTITYGQRLFEKSKRILALFKKSVRLKTRDLIGSSHNQR